MLIVQNHVAPKDQNLRTKRGEMKKEHTGKSVKVESIYLWLEQNDIGCKVGNLKSANECPKRGPCGDWRNKYAYRWNEQCLSSEGPINKTKARKRKAKQTKTKDLDMLNSFFR